jgi:hypothetical protein
MFGPYNALFPSKYTDYDIEGLRLLYEIAPPYDPALLLIKEEFEILKKQLLLI